MDPFKGISVTLGLVVGLGVARILSAGVNVFKSRSHAHVDWVPLVWAGCIFLWQLQFWWAIMELPELVETWTIDEFLLLLSMTLSLFVAAALVLPSSEIIEGESVGETFREHGRWALLFLSLYFVLAIVVNWYLFDTPPFEYPGYLNFGLVVLPLVYLYLPQRRAREGVTVVYVALALWAAWEMSPKAY